MFALALAQQAEIDIAVQHVKAQLYPEVQQIRWELAKDWSGQWAIYFRVVLSDDAGNRRLRSVVNDLVRRLAERFGFPSTGRFSVPQLQDRV
jgi:hypothetical protein